MGIKDRIKNICKALVLTGGLTIAASGCASECEDKDIPRFIAEDKNASMEILETAIVDLDDVLEYEGCCLDIFLENDPEPFIVDRVLDEDGYKLRVTAPDSALINSDYRDYKKVRLTAASDCGESSIWLYLRMKYGCEEVSSRFEDRDGVYSGKVLSTRYLQKTGIIIGEGLTAKISASGTVCWARGSNCEGPDQTANTWGLWAKIGEQYLRVGSSAEFTNTTTEDLELQFLLPDSERPSDTLSAGDESYCISQHYKDNRGAFDVDVELVWPPI